MLKKLWHDPVWSKVIAAAIVAASATLASYLFGWLPTIWNWSLPGFVFLGSTKPVPRWLLLILLVLAVMTFSRWIGAFRRVPNIQPWRRYTKDTFYGWVWRWEYDGAGEPCDLRSYCPECDFELTDYFGTDWSDQYSSQNACPDCHKQIQPLGDKQQVRAKVNGKIEQNIRSRYGVKI